MRFPKILLLIVLTLVFLASMELAQKEKPETGFSQPGTFSSSEPEVAEWKLPNGLEIVHIRKPSLKVLASVVTVNVGSKDETVATSGLSHLLEHMVFDGTNRRTRGEINEGSKRYGGYVNATTQQGLTCYLSIFPMDYAALSLDLQADMLFHSTLPASELEKERKVVIEEMKKDRDTPSTRATEYHDELLFVGTPYARPVLGFENTIATVPRATVLSYYHLHYTPSRMKALIISPFSKTEIEKWMQTTFGAAAPILPVSSNTPRWSFPHHSSTRYQEDSVPSGYLEVSLPAPALSDPDFYAYDLLTRYLAEGRASRLEEALRSGRPPLADSVGADLVTQSSFSVWRLSVVAPPAQIPDVLQSLQRTLESVAMSGIPSEEMARLQRQVASQQAILAEQTMYYGFMKAPMLNARGYRFTAAYPGRLRAVTPEAVARVAEKYFSRPVLFSTALVPPGKIPAMEPAADAHAWKREVLPNGLTLIAKGSDESDVFAMTVLTRQRSAVEPAGWEGISDFVQRMLLQGTATRTHESIQKTLDALAAQIQYVDNPFIPYDDAWTTNRWNFFRLEVLDELRDEALDLMGDIIAHSNFPETQVATVRDEIMRLQQRESDNSAKRASQRLHEILLSPTPYTRLILGNEASLQKITRQDLLDHFRLQFSPSNLVVLAAGKGTTTGLMRDLKSRFEGLKGPAIQISSALPSARQGFLLEKLPSAKQQTQIAAGTITAGWSSPHAPALRVLNSILSEHLAVELREKQGLAYSVGSDLIQEKDYGWMEVRMGTRAETSEQARQGILAVIRSVASGGITPEERERAINGLWGSLLRQRLPRIGQTFYRGLDEVRGPGFDAEDRLLPALQAVTLDDLKHLAPEVLDPDHWVMVSMGRK